jgi:dTDP-4-dehydrorhamnose 3,5-epimerase
LLNAKPLDLAGVTLISPTRFEDARGYFEETFNARDFADAIGHDVEFVQDNTSRSTAIGTVRGLHFQLAPGAQGKLVRVLSGRVADVVVDVRASSTTFGKHLMLELCAERGQQLWIPEGMAHGFCTLEPNTVLSYKVTGFYDPAAERCLSWSDPALDIDWPVDPDRAALSEKDAAAPLLSELRREGHVFN